MSSDITQIIIHAVREIGQEQGLEVGEKLDADTRLFGENGLLDSLGLVSLVIAVSQAIEESMGVAVDLADDKALSQKHSPYRSIGTLAAYAAQEVEARRTQA
jgi:D-alanine--poly(phosphoribitol) ligase subunit 2